MVQRISDLSADLPADLFFEQIKQLILKTQDMKQAKENLAKQTHELMKHELDEKGLVEKILRTIERLDTAPLEKQRPILGNLIKFIEIHPLKIKIGMFAPVQATGTDGFVKVNSESQENKGKLIPFSPIQRVGSSTDGIGAP